MSSTSLNKSLDTNDRQSDYETEGVAAIGVDNWVSSDIHAKTEVAKDTEEQKALYKQWASSYENEMHAHGLVSYKSVTRKAISLLAARPVGPTLSVIDVGCGTGLLGQHFREAVLSSKAVEVEKGGLTLVGTDLSPDMLAEAAAKKCFDHLEVSNLNQRLPFPEQSFDMIISSGVFLPGHCGPESIPNMLVILKVGGHAVFTVREAFYKEEGAAFRATITASGCELLEADLMPYYGEIQANVLVVRKTRSIAFAVPPEIDAKHHLEYETKGWTSLGVTVSPTELTEIHAYVKSRFRENHPGNIYDSQDKLRAVHGYDSRFAPQLMNRLANLAKQLIGCDEVYVYQFRVNSKQPTKDGSGSWKPHRDYDFWQGMDGMPSPRAVLFHILVSEHHETNGPVMMCDGSHKAKVEPVVAPEDGWKVGFQEEGFKYTIKRELVDAWDAKTALVGPPGTCAVMHPLIWHYSEPNTSKESRLLLSVVFNDVENVNVQPQSTKPRPRFVVQKPLVVF